MALISMLSQTGSVQVQVDTQGRQLQLPVEPKLEMLPERFTPREGRRVDVRTWHEIEQACRDLGLDTRPAG